MRMRHLTVVAGLLWGCAAPEGTPPHHRAEPASMPPTAAPEPSAAAPADGASLPDASPPLQVCSFNIQFLGSFKKRDDEALADVVKDYDLVVVQELVSPPFDLTFEDGTSMAGDPEAREFFDAMTARGFQFWLSEEDTGTGESIHSNSTGTEFYVAFFKPDRVSRADHLPHGFLGNDRSNHPDFERVPYAFSFRTTGGTSDFVFISVHLKPDGTPASRARRKHELASIAAWVDVHDEVEKDFIILGDMNIENAAELADATPTGYLSLNDECQPTNTNLNGPKPYDHVMYRPEFTSEEMDRDFDFKVVDLVALLGPMWNGPGPYPGAPYVHDTFRQVYSDHNPVLFRVLCSGVDDD